MRCMATPISSQVKEKNIIFTARCEDMKYWYFISIYIRNTNIGPVLSMKYIRTFATVCNLQQMKNSCHAN